MATTSPETLLLQAAKRSQQRIGEHIERFAAAYIKLTGIPANEAVMHYKVVDGDVRIWFEKKGSADATHAQCEAMAVRIMGQEAYDNSACQAHPLEVLEEWITK